jgi:hypothetical protein
MEDDLNREALRRTLEQQDLVEILQELSRSELGSPKCPVTAYGWEIKRRVNGQLVGDFQEPIQGSDLAVGYVALLYEAVNGTDVEEELSIEQPLAEGGVR